ncbi:hypothetical protein [Bacillus sp. JJ722]|uniref:hypothetical protein n=1 Tax=Bacillus sp. JJ722 TaxID=3122973 RepID=UPI002FFE792D
MTLQDVGLIKQVTKEAREKFESNVLESKEFKDLVRGIELRAESGFSTFKYAYVGDEPRILGWFSKQLKSKGYTVTDTRGGYGFTVSWE